MKSKNIPDPETKAGGHVGKDEVPGIGLESTPLTSLSGPGALDTPGRSGTGARRAAATGAAVATAVSHPADATQQCAEPAARRTQELLTLESTERQINAFFALK